MNSLTKNMLAGLLAAFSTVGLHGAENSKVIRNNHSIVVAMMQSGEQTTFSITPKKPCDLAGCTTTLNALLSQSCVNAAFTLDAGNIKLSSNKPQVVQSVENILCFSNIDVLFQPISQK